MYVQYDHLTHLLKYIATYVLTYVCKYKICKVRRMLTLEPSSVARELNILDCNYSIGMHYQYIRNSGYL